MCFLCEKVFYLKCIITVKALDFKEKNAILFSINIIFYFFIIKQGCRLVKMLKRVRVPSPS